MTDPIRSALKRLLSAVLDGLGQDDHPMGWARVDDAIDAARAALADEPAVPDGREPASVTGQPSDEELIDFQNEWFQSGRTEIDVTEFQRATLARWGHQPAPPADGEVAELVEWLREQLHVCLQAPWTPGIKHFGRAAELLERQATACAICERERLHQSTRAADLEVERQAAPVPVPVNERLPEPEDCDAEGRCWWFCFECPGEHSYWILAKEVYCNPTYWLPAHALPLRNGQPSIAAALRAAADQLPLQPLTRDPADPFEQGLRQGQELSRAELLGIAAELEAT